MISLSMSMSLAAEPDVLSLLRSSDLVEMVFLCCRQIGPYGVKLY